MKRGAAILALLAAAALAVTSAASAAKPGTGSGGKKSTSTITIASATVQSFGAPIALKYGSNVWFTVQTSETSWPWVDAKCFQSGKLVYEQWHGEYAGYYTDPMFTLGPTELWTGGAASCTADLVAFDNAGNARVLATTAFDVAS